MKLTSSAVLTMVLFASAVAAQPGMSLPAGTGLRIRLQTPLSTQKSKVGDVFTGRVIEAVLVNGQTMVPVGASVKGRVTKLTEPRRIAGTPTIGLLPDRIVMPNGKQFLITAMVVDTAKSSGTSVDDEGQIHGTTRTGGDSAELAGGAGAGAVIGTLAGGAKGLFLGGGLGFAAVAAHWLTKRHSAELPAGTEITLEFNRPLTMSSTGMPGE